MKIYMPWKNLGCLGIRIGDWYMDIFLKPYFGYFISNPYKGITRRGRIW
jgi:hypothetical protein